MLVPVSIPSECGHNTTGKIAWPGIDSMEFVGWSE